MHEIDSPLDTKGFGAFFVKLFQAGGRLADKVTDKLDPLPATPKADPHLDDRLRDALDLISGVAPIVTTVSVPAMPARAGLPSVPARIQVIGQLGPRMLPASLWDELIAGGWVTSAGRLSEQYERVIAAEFEA